MTLQLTFAHPRVRDESRPKPSDVIDPDEHHSLSEWED